MIAVRVQWNDAEVRSAIRRMRRDGKNFSPALRELRPALRVDLVSHARRQEGPDGAWPKRKESTLGRYKFRSSIRKTPTLKKRIRRRRRRLLGRLPTSINFVARRNELTAESKVAWSGVHQTGGRVGRGAVLPARPHVFVSDPFFKYASRHCLAFVMRGWGR